ncbi:hypothetical protein C0993_010912, partial [Termitomyces sp. T159_Od127]
MIPTELNYNIYDKELLAIVEAFKQWWAYLEGALHHIQSLLRPQQPAVLHHDQAAQPPPSSLVQNPFQPDALTWRPDVYPKKLFEVEHNKLQLLAFHTHSMIPAELNYDIYDKELLAIIEAFKQWWAYLK